jgi:proline iminopeptidase
MDVELYHREVGAGVPCLVMHGGLGVDHTTLRAGLDPLADVLRLVYYDHRGNGRSARPPVETIGFATLADDADALRGALGHERGVVVGHSFGGCVALTYALRHPERVRGLVLVGTWPRFDHLPALAAELERRRVGEDVVAALVAVPDDPAAMAARERALAPIAFHRAPAANHERVFREVVWAPGAAARSRELMPTFDVVARLGEIAAPTLVLTGRYDVYGSPSQAERIAAGIPEAELVVFEESAHYPFVEEPDAFERVVRRWLARP